MHFVVRGTCKKYQNIPLLWSMVHQKYSKIHTFCGSWYMQKVPKYITFVVYGTLKICQYVPLLWSVVHPKYTKYNHTYGSRYMQKYRIFNTFVIHGLSSNIALLPFAIYGTLKYWHLCVMVHRVTWFVVSFTVFSAWCSENETFCTWKWIKNQVQWWTIIHKWQVLRQLAV